MGAEEAAAGGGYAQAGAATFDTAVNWLVFGQEQQQIQRWRNEDLALAKEAQELALRQQAYQNRLSSQQMGMVQDEFNFGKMKWGEEFGLTSKQINQNMKLQRQQEKRNQEQFDINKRMQAISNISNTLNSVLQNDIGMKQLVAQRLGA